MTFSEVLLWNELKNKGMLGFDFDRQRPIGNYIVDFFCKDLSLAIEVDGDTHLYRYEYDEQRQAELEKMGVIFLRFDDLEVKKRMNNVLRTIAEWIQKNKPTPDPPLKRGRLSREGNRIDRPTPNPSREGNRLDRPTSDPTQKGNGLDKPTPDPSQEGNLKEETP
jgi:very-short-patch-repair endonuclease